MTTPRAYPFSNLLESFTWSSSSSSTPQYSPRASFTSPRERAVNYLGEESSLSSSFSNGSIVAAGVAAASGRIPPVSPEPPALGDLLVAEEDSGASPGAPPLNADSTSKTTCSSACTNESCDTLGTPAAREKRKTGTSEHPASAVAVKDTWPARRMGDGDHAPVTEPAVNEVLLPAFAGLRGSAASAAPSVCESPANAAASGAAARSSATSGGTAGDGCLGRKWLGEERKEGRRGRCAYRARTVVSLLSMIEPVRHAAVSSFFYGCYFFLLAASVRLLFSCNSDIHGKPLSHVVKAVVKAPATTDAKGSTAPLDSTFSPPEFALKEKPSPVSSRIHSLVQGMSVNTQPLLSPKRVKPASRARSSSSSPSSLSSLSSASSSSSSWPAPSPASPGRVASSPSYVVVSLPSASPPAFDFSRLALPPSPSSSFSPRSVTSPTSAEPSSSPSSTGAAAQSADVVAAPLPVQEWPQDNLYYWVAYNLYVAWAATGVCAAVAAWLTYRSHGGVLTAASLLDVRFPVDGKHGDVGIEEDYAEDEEDLERAAVEAKWISIDSQASRQRNAAEEKSFLAETHQRAGHDFRSGAASTCRDKCGRQEEIKQRQIGVEEAPARQLGQLRHQQEQPVRQRSSRHHYNSSDDTVQLSWQPQRQQRHRLQERCEQGLQQPCGQHEQPQEGRTSAQEAPETCKEAPEQLQGDSRERNLCDRQGVRREDTCESTDERSHAQADSPGISFMGQGQMGSFAAAIRRGSVSSGLSSSSMSNRMGSIVSCASSSIGDLGAPRFAAGAFSTMAADIGVPDWNAAASTAGGAGQATPTHARYQTLSPLQQKDCGRLNSGRNIPLQSSRQQQQQQQKHLMRQAQYVPLAPQQEPRLLPLLESSPFSLERNEASILRRPPLGSWTASYVSLAVGGSLCACLQESLLLLAVALETQQPSMWSVVTFVAYSDWMAIELVVLAFRKWGCIFPHWRARGALTVAVANAVLLLLLLRSNHESRFTQHMQGAARPQACAEASKADAIVHEPAAVPAAVTDEAAETHLPNQVINVAAACPLSERSNAVAVLAILASLCALLADISLAFCLESGVSVVSTVIIRGTTQGVVGAAGIFHRLIAGKIFFKGIGWQACSLGLFGPAVAGLVLGPTAVYAFSQSVKLSTLLLAATVRSTCWVVVALLALLAHSQLLSVEFASALSMTFVGTCLFAWDGWHASYATRRRTNGVAQDSTISSGQDEETIFSSHVYRELLDPEQDANTLSRPANKASRRSFT